MKIKYKDLHFAFYSYNEYSCYDQERLFLNKHTGNIESADDEDDDYIFLPCESDFDSDYHTIRFIKNLEGDDFDKIFSVFRGKGKYRRLKDELFYMNKIDEYHKYIDIKIKEFLINWCDENNIEVI